MSEQDYKDRLAEARSRRSAAERLRGKAAQAEKRLSFREKISKHWMLLVLAISCDILGLIPYVGVIFNAGFAMLLGWFSSLWKEKEKPNVMDMVLAFVLGSALDLILFGIIPVNLFATLRRIARSQEIAE